MTYTLEDICVRLHPDCRASLHYKRITQTVQPELRSWELQA